MVCHHLLQEESFNLLLNLVGQLTFSWEALQSQHQEPQQASDFIRVLFITTITMPEIITLSLTQRLKQYLSRSKNNEIYFTFISTYYLYDLSVPTICST